MSSPASFLIHGKHTISEETWDDIKCFPSEILWQNSISQNTVIAIKLINDSETVGERDVRWTSPSLTSSLSLSSLPQMASDGKVLLVLSILLSPGSCQRLCLSCITITAGEDVDPQHVGLYRSDCSTLIGWDLSRLCSHWLDHDVADASSRNVPYRGMSRPLLCLYGIMEAYYVL